MGETSKSTAIMVALLALIVAYAFWSGDGISYLGMNGIKAQRVHADSLRDSIAVLTAKIDTTRRDLAKESVEDVTKRVAAYTASLNLLRSLVPEQREVTNLLDDVTARSRARGVRMTAFTPAAPVAGPPPFDTYAYQFTVVGHYNQVAAFLTDIASLRRIMVPGDLKMAAASAEQGKVFGDTTSMLEASFTVKTYVKAKPAEDSTNAH